MALAVSSQAFGMDEVEELKRRLDALEQRSAVSAEPSGEKKGSISFGGLVEVEANYQDTEGAESTTDLTLATFELGVEARVNPWLSAYGVLLYEQGESDDRFIVDEAYIRMKSDSSPIFAEVGRFTQSFGRFESGMISDPMTLELGETKHHASVKAGYEQEGLLASLPFSREMSRRLMKTRSTASLHPLTGQKRLATSITVSAHPGPITSAILTVCRARMTQLIARLMISSVVGLPALWLVTNPLS